VKVNPAPETSKPTVLFADNNLEYLITRKEFLEEEGGYVVLTANSPKEARQILRTHRIDLAILDIRMENDNDRSDISGLSLAKEISAILPTIVATGYPSVELVRETLEWNVPGHTSYVQFITKWEGPGALLAAAQAALS
jgi:CheY-like chemotaxis protein